MKNKKHSEKTKKQQSESHLNMTEDTKKQIGQKSKAMWQNPESRKKVLEHIQNPTKETRKRMSEAKIGKPSWNKGLPNTWTNLSKKYIITFPDSSTQEITNLRQFAKDHNLSQGTLHMTSSGKRKSHKGFKCELVEVIS